MPELKCTVQTCVHNDQFLCRLDRIQVGGSNAKNQEDTCCDSFQERKGSNCVNSMKDASDYASIDCSADKCMYNENCQCHAGTVSVEGGSAKAAQGTECATFRCHC